MKYPLGFYLRPAVAFALASLLSWLPAEAATNTVLNLNDGLVSGTLRFMIANSAPGDTIVFNSGLTGTLVLTSGELVINKNLTLLGPGPKVITVSGNNISRVFYVTNATASIAALTIANGRLVGANGAVSGAPGESVYGAGIFNAGTLTIMDCSVLQNYAQGGAGILGNTIRSPGAGGGALGGAICNNGTLTLERCTLMENKAQGGNAGGGIFSASAGGAVGGGVYNTGALTLQNCTVVANSVTGGNGGNGLSGGAGGIAQGGALYNAAQLTVAACTISANTNTGGLGGSGSPAGAPGTASGGGIRAASGTSIIRNTIVAGNIASSGPDVTGDFTSQGFNLIGNGAGSTGLGVSCDLVGTTLSPLNPMLSPLYDYGGSTPTMVPQPGSLAIDQGDSGGIATDQRGRPRPFDGPLSNSFCSNNGSDIGAVEVNPVTLVVSNVNNSGVGSLREAILDASSADGGTITFATNVIGTIALTSGELVIGKSMTIQGPTVMPVIVSGNNASRVFRVTSNSIVNISSLTISNGNTGAQGAGFYNDFGCTLVLSNCAVLANISGNNGGGIANNGSFAAYNCTISSNRASFVGGGIYSYAGPVVLRNCTIVSNTATGSHGGGIGNYSLVAGTSNYITGTLVAGNSAVGHADVIGVFTSGGYNLIGQIDYSTPDSGAVEGVPTSGLANGVNHDLGGSTVSPIDPKIGPLQNNGGATPTVALLSNSPAIDQGKSLGLTTDQRGAPRPFDFAMANASGGDGSDVGAFELGSPTLNIQVFTSNAVIAWPYHYGDFTLQSVTNIIASNSWAIVPGTPVVIANQYVLTNGPISGNRFFRLKGN